MNDSESQKNELEFDRELCVTYFKRLRFARRGGRLFNGEQGFNPTIDSNVADYLNQLSKGLNFGKQFSKGIVRSKDVYDLLYYAKDKLNMRF